MKYKFWKNKKLIYSNQYGGWIDPEEHPGLHENIQYWRPTIIKFKKKNQHSKKRKYRKVNLVGWDELKEKDIPYWVMKSANKKAWKLKRWHGFFITGKNYKYYIDHLGGQGTIIYRKYKYRKRISGNLLLILFLILVLLILILNMLRL